jgi:hypothetical protein
MIFDSGCSTSVTHCFQSFFDQKQQEQERRDIQELQTIRRELFYRLADLAEEDNPNIVVGTVHQEFREVFEDHLDQRVFETFHQDRSLHDYHYIRTTRGKTRADGTFSLKYRLVKQPARELATWRAISQTFYPHLRANQVMAHHQEMKDKKETLMAILKWALACLTVMAALQFLPKT